MLNKGHNTPCHNLLTGGIRVDAVAFRCCGAGEKSGVVRRQPRAECTAVVQIKAGERVVGADGFKRLAPGVVPTVNTVSFAPVLGGAPRQGGNKAYGSVRVLCQQFFRHRPAVGKVRSSRSRVAQLPQGEVGVVAAPVIQ